MSHDDEPSFTAWLDDDEFEDTDEQNYQTTQIAGMWDDNEDDEDEEYE